MSAVWAAHGQRTAVVTITNDFKGFGPLVYGTRWGNKPVPRAKDPWSRPSHASWTRLRLAPQPGTLWSGQLSPDDDILAAHLAEALRRFDRVLITDDDTVCGPTCLGSLVDTVVLTLEALAYPREIPGSSPTPVPLSPAESAGRWHERELGYAGNLSAAGLLLLHKPAGQDPARTHSTKEMESHLARYGTPVLGSLPRVGHPVPPPSTLWIPLSSRGSPHLHGRSSRHHALARAVIARGDLPGRG
ncbi:hypothetical protein P8605_03000 [Streptomyces sp. T-3]|nr:hypothetical protein [Streptomyces sp. T-3]